LNSNEGLQIEQNVMNNICDLGVIYGKPQNEDLSYHHIGVDKLVLVASPTYEIEEEINFEDLLTHPLVLLSDSTNIQENISVKLRDLKKDMKDLNVLYYSDSTESVKSSVLNDYGIGFLPYIAIKKDVYRKQLKMITISDFSIEYDMYLIYDKRITKNSVLNDFISYFMKIAQKSLC